MRIRKVKFKPIRYLSSKADNKRCPFCKKGFFKTELVFLVTSTVDKFKPTAVHKDCITDYVKAAELFNADD